MKSSSLAAFVGLRGRFEVIEFRSLADDEPSLSYSPLLRGFLKTFAYVAEHGGIGLTASKAFKRNFVHWASASGQQRAHFNDFLCCRKCLVLGNYKKL